MMGTPFPCEQTDKQKDMSGNITFATPLADGNEYFPHNCLWTSKEKFGDGDVIAGVGEKLILRYETPTIIDFLNRLVLIGADDGFREQSHIRNH